MNRRLGAGRGGGKGVVRVRLPGLLAALLIVSGAAAVELGGEPGASAADSPSPTLAAPSVPGSFVAVRPTRILDTRYGTAGNRHGRVGPYVDFPVRVAGVSPLPATGVAAVAITLTVVGPTQTGGVIAWQDGRSRPTATNLHFLARQSPSDLAIVPVSPTTGRIRLYNRSAGSTDLVADVTGYYVGGAASAAGTFTPLPPSRVLDTRYGTQGNRKGVLAPGETIGVQLTGKGGIPSSGVAAVALTLTDVGPTRTGAAIVWQSGLPRPRATNLQYPAGRSVTDLVVVPVSATGRVALYNYSTGSTHYVMDVAGYFHRGSPSTAGALQTVSPSRVLDTRSGVAGNRKGIVGPKQQFSVQVGGRAGGVPSTGVSAVAVTITALGGTSTGGVTAWAAGTARPTATNLHYEPGIAVSNLAIVPVSAGGAIDLYNYSAGSVHLVIDVTGFVLASDLTGPRVYRSHYLRTADDTRIAAAATAAATLARTAGGTALTVLHIGAQTTKNLPSPGVLLSVTTIRLTYAQLVGHLKGYIDAYAGAAPGSPAVLVVDTNGSGDFTAYPAAARGADWANQVVEPLAAYAARYPGISVVGGNDIENGFVATEAQVESWVKSYLAATSGPFIFTGAASGCPTTPGTIGGVCNNGWTVLQHYRLAGGLNPARIRVLPQIYVPAQAVQWANIDATGGGGLTFLGSLDEYKACTADGGTGCPSPLLTPQQGWIALRSSLAGVGKTLPFVATDLEIVR